MVDSEVLAEDRLEAASDVAWSDALEIKPLKTAQNGRGGLSDLLRLAGGRADRPWMATLYVPGSNLAALVDRDGPLGGARLRALVQRFSGCSDGPSCRAADRG